MVFDAVAARIGELPSQTLDIAELNERARDGQEERARITEDVRRRHHRLSGEVGAPNLRGIFDLTRAGLRHVFVHPREQEVAGFTSSRPDYCISVLCRLLRGRAFCCCRIPYPFITCMTGERGSTASSSVWPRRLLDRAA